MHATSRSLV